MKKFLVLILALGLMGCDTENISVLSDIQNKLSEKGVKIDLETGEIAWSFNGDDNSEDSNTTNTGDEDTPYGWPNAIVAYTGSSVVDAQTLIKNNVATMTLELTTSDTPATVSSFYNGVLAVNGYTVTSSSSENNYATLVAESDEYNFKLVASMSGDTTTITLTVSSK